MNKNSAITPDVICLPGRTKKHETLATSQAVIRLPGRVDSIISSFLEQDLKQKLQPGVTLIIDMANTKVIEPAITSVFWEGVMQSHREGAKIIAKGMNEQVKHVLEQSGLLPHLQ